MQPEQLGPFRISRVIGRGGMGAVYEGVHVETGAVAAVKVLLAMLEEDEELRLRFEAEIDTLKRLRHPNIVRLYGFGEEQGVLYYVMELVNGPSLQQEMKKRRAFEWSEAAKIGLEMCSALKHAHDRGITHRDIKPANILLEQRGGSKLSDYGIAQLFGGDRLTGINSVVGTLEYMAPEQALANPVGPRSDLYSLGAVLYSILVGRPPFTAKTLAEIIRKQQNNTPDPIRATRLDVPDELEAIIFDLLRIKQEERPSNAYMAGKRFQSLLQALVGPPEKILVRPMEENDSVLPPAAVHLLSTDSDKRRGEIGVPRGIVAEGGLIDLGGIVQPIANTVAADISNNIVSESHLQPSELQHDSNADLLEISFGRPADEPRVVDDFELQAPLVDSPIAPESEDEHARFLRDEYKRRGIPLPNDVTKNNRSPRPIDSSNELSIDEQTLRTPLKDPDDLTGINSSVAGSSRKVSPQTPRHPSVRHGEILLDERNGWRRTKDEPIPDASRFDDVFARIADTPDSPVYGIAANDPVNEREKATQWTDRKPSDSPSVSEGKQFPPPPSKVLPEAFSGGPSSPANRSDGALNEIEKNAEGCSVASIDDDKPIQSVSRFVSVDDDELGGYGEMKRSGRFRVSLQTILTSLCLVLVGLLFYHSLQPLPPDQLYQRITETLKEDEYGDYFPSSLRQASQDIDIFLSQYSSHPKAEAVRNIKDELDLANKEQELKRRQVFANPEARSPAEWAYMEAISYSRTDLEKEIVLLRGIVDLFATEPPAKPTGRKLNIPNESEKCVELARRRLKKLEPLFEKIAKSQFDVVKMRLDHADELNATVPDRATEIRRGVIELYQDRPWAAQLVERAQKGLR